MDIRLIMETQTGEPRLFPIQKPRTIIGRDAHCDIRIALPSVGGEHCELLLHGRELRLHDRGAKYGTLHNGHAVQHASLTDGDHITIGPVTFELRISNNPPPDEPASDDASANPPPAGGTTAPTPDS